MTEEKKVKDFNEYISEQVQATREDVRDFKTDINKRIDGLAVLEAYGFDKNFSEEEIVSALMILYKNLTSSE